MATITLKINERSKAGKALKELIDILSDQPGVEVIESENEHYNPAFVKKVKDSYKKDQRVRIEPEKVWEML